jgi:phenylacetate-CoA ligase
MELCDRELDVKAAMRSGRLELASTSGSTDERLQILTDASLVRVPSEFRAIFGLDTAAFPPGEAPRTAVFTSRTCLSEQCRLEASPLASRIVHDYTLFLPAPHDPFRLAPDEVRQISDELHQFRPAFFFVNPVYAHLLARRAAELDVRLPSVVLTLSCYQYGSKFQRGALESYFGAPVRNLYAATELGGCQVGLECHRGELHLREDHCLVELMVGERDAEAGEPGAVIVSTLAGRTMPLVRYELGDLAAPRDERCDCPLADWPVVTFHGRTAEALFVDSRWITTRAIDEAMPTDAGIDFYCCRQRAAREFSIEVVPALGAPFRPSLLREGLREVLGGGEIRISEVRALGPLPSLKYPLTKREIAAPPFGALDGPRA